MVSSGIPVPNPDHVSELADMALTLCNGVTKFEVEINFYILGSSTISLFKSSSSHSYCRQAFFCVWQNWPATVYGRRLRIVQTGSWRYAAACTVVRWSAEWWGLRCRGTVCLVTQSTSPVAWSPLENVSTVHYITRNYQLISLQQSSKTPLHSVGRVVLGARVAIRME